MELVLSNDANLFDKVQLSLTRRDIALIDICLGIVANNYTKGPNLRSEIEGLRTKLTNLLSLQDSPKNEQLEFVEATRNKYLPKNRHMVEKVKDPICGMRIDPKSVAAKSEYLGKTYYFCTAGCKKAFDARPEKYANPLATGLEARGP